MDHSTASPPTSTPKNIVICSDGTGNIGGKGRGTNVFKLYEAVDRHGHRPEDDDGDPLPPQIAFYDDGVGTESLKPLKILGGAFGLGLTRNVKELYKQLCRSYRPGDRIYLFGFSRGAFTVRTLAGLVVTCGIVDGMRMPSGRELDRRVDEAYREYRRRYRRYRKPEDMSTVGRPLKTRDDVFDGVSIEFIGVWDTVDALGLPFDEAAEVLDRIRRFRFPNRKLSPRVKKGCQALAIDDERHTFHPVLWDQEGEEDDTRIVQVWFAGVHSNVGGGYPKQGLSLVSLDWMMTEAEAAGLHFLASRRNDYRFAQNVHDKLYDSRSGPGAYYRYRPRDIGALCALHCVPIRIHASVFDRITHATQGYAPGNLPRQYQAVFTADEGGERSELISTIVGDALDAIPDQESPSPLARVRRKVWLRRAAHYAFLTASAGLFLLLVGVEELGRWDLLGFWRSLRAITAAPVETLLTVSPEWLAVLGLLSFLAWFVGWRLKREMHDEFSRIWARGIGALRDDHPPPPAADSDIDTTRPEP
ncbi:MAG: DUF2235 domain-containing protein [Gemmatimonadota bacterium]|nr:DUF2235 domain-containing protein [Gemmatimonadota bacterium]